jgi:threonine synthase
MQEVSASEYVCHCLLRGNLSILCTDVPASPETILSAISTSTATPDSLWRYEPFLPVSSAFASGLAVGRTPLYDVGTVNEVHLFFKDESRNPSGSLKDRATEVVLAFAREQGIREVIVASTGNAAASTACIGAAMRLTVNVIVPRDVPDVKLAQAIAYGARVFKINGDYEDAFELARKITEIHGTFNRNTGLNPFTREGKKTCALEIAEQLGWSSPDWVIVPTGDGNILSGIWKGFCELRALKITAGLPRLVAAQAESSNAISRALDVHRGFHPGPHRVVAPSTIADSISVRKPRDATAAVGALIGSRGFGFSVSDADIITAIHQLASTWGLFVEPSSAAAFATFQQLTLRGHFNPGDRVICLLTGTGLKDLRPALLEGSDARISRIEPNDWRHWPPQPGRCR